MSSRSRDWRSLAVKSSHELCPGATSLCIRSGVLLRSSLEAVTSSLSGGNQQKVVLSKWLTANSDILMLDEPTRGVDVGAKSELHAWIDQKASQGAAVLLISSELLELLNVSTRTIVLRDGRIRGEVSRADATQELLLRTMAGLD